MTSSAGSNLHLVTVSNAAQFPNHVLVIDIGAGQLGGAPGFSVQFDNQTEQALVNVSIDPALDTDDEIIAETNGG